MLKKIWCILCYVYHPFHSDDPLKITRDPESQSVATGTHTSLRVEATGDDLQFQWQKNNMDIDSSDPQFQCYSSGGASTLRIQHTEKSDIGCYRCLVKSPVEKSGKPSNEADLSVCKLFFLLLLLLFFVIPTSNILLLDLMFFHSVDPPEITQDPESQSIATGADASFRVEATGDELQFQWQKDERNIIDNESRFTSMLRIHHVQKSDKGHYRCLIKNPVEKKGKYSHEAELTVCKLFFLL